MLPNIFTLLLIYRNYDFPSSGLKSLDRLQILMKQDLTTTTRLEIFRLIPELGSLLLLMQTLANDLSPQDPCSARHQHSYLGIRKRIPSLPPLIKSQMTLELNLDTQLLSLLLTQTQSHSPLLETLHLLIHISRLMKQLILLARLPILKLLMYLMKLEPTRLNKRFHLHKHKSTRNKTGSVVYSRQLRVNYCLIACK